MGGDRQVRGWRVESCRGPQGCPNRAADDDALAAAIDAVFARRRFREALEERVGGPLKARHEFRVAIADCPNACSQPQIADLGLIGAAEPRITNETCLQCLGCVHACREGAVQHPGLLPIIDPARCLACGQCARLCLSRTIQVGRRGYRVLVGGKLGRHPRLGSELRGIYGHDALLAVAECCLDHYLAHGREGERFGTTLERTGLDGLALRILERAHPLGVEPATAGPPILRGPV